jgi:hypothetical protein
MAVGLWEEINVTRRHSGRVGSVVIRSKFREFEQGIASLRPV